MCGSLFWALERHDSLSKARRAKPLADAQRVGVRIGVGHGSIGVGVGRPASIREGIDVGTAERARALPVA